MSLRVSVVALSAILLAAPASADDKTAAAVSEADVRKLVELGLEDQVIIARVEKAGLGFTADEAALERLKRAGASAAVLATVRRAGGAAPVITYQDVLNLLKLGIAEGDVIKRLEKSPTVFTLNKSQVDELTSAGASDRLLARLQGQSGPPVRVGDVTDFAIILDCSGSMADRTAEGGPTKMEVAKQAVTALIDAVPDGRSVAFIVYGHDAELRCEAVAVLRPLSELDAAGKAGLKRAIARLRPVGHTPIARALRVAGKELAKKDGLAGVILITDGMETCHGDPNAEAASLAANPKLAFGLHVVGFGVDPKEQKAVEAIARAGRGKFHNAESPAKLTEALQLRGKQVAASDAPAIEDPLVRALVEDLRDKDGRVRRQAAESLAKMGAKAGPAVPYLIKRVADDVWIGGVFAHAADPEAGGKGAALDALKTLAPGRVTEALLAARQSTNAGVKAWALRELGRLNEKK
jgi:hypothetical protein